MNKRRVVVTGLGTINSLGKNVREFSDNLKDGKSGIRDTECGYLKEIGLVRGGYLENFHPEVYGIDAGINRVIQIVLIAAREAVEDSKYNLSSVNPYRIGISLGTAVGTYSVIEEYHRNNMVHKETDVLTLENLPPSQMGIYVAREFNIKGPNTTFVNACAAGTNSIGYGMDLIRDGKCDVVLAGGGDPLTFLSQTGFHLMMSLSKDECRPFNNEKSGILIGEGAAILVLESLENAIKRKAKIYAEVLGYGLSNDAYHPTAPDPKGEGAIRSMFWAFEDANISPDDIDYINAHGTGTKLNDQMEIAGMKMVFGERLKKIPISSIKGAIGHTLGLAGSIEALSCILGITEKYLPPTINMVEPMEPDFDFVANKSREFEINYCLSNSFAFGGNTSSIVLGRYKTTKED
jgi:3-oxoacyl-[acyl-carrier-protein] synthase II